MKRVIITKAFASLVLALPLVIICFSLIKPTINYAATTDKYGLEKTAQTAELNIGTKGTPQENLNKLIGLIIKTVLGLVGVIFMIMLMGAGQLWLSAGGNEEKVKQAEAIIFNSVIGVLITLSAYISTNFLIKFVVQFMKLN